jgi:hypothetical protein
MHISSRPEILKTLISPILLLYPIRRLKGSPSILSQVEPYAPPCSFSFPLPSPSLPLSLFEGPICQAGILLPFPSRALAAVFVFDSAPPFVPDGGDVVDDDEEGIF